MLDMLRTYPTYPTYPRFPGRNISNISAVSGPQHIRNISKHIQTYSGSGTCPTYPELPWPSRQPRPETYPEHIRNISKHIQHILAPEHIQHILGSRGHSGSLVLKHIRNMSNISNISWIRNISSLSWVPSTSSRAGRRGRVLTPYTRGSRSRTPGLYDLSDRRFLRPSARKRT